MAVVFTVALTFATLQLPRMLCNWLINYFPDIHPAIEPERVAEFIVVARHVGYTCFAIIAVLALAGFVASKKRLSIFHSFAMTFPTRLALKKDLTETGNELLATFAVYATLFILLSAPFVFLEFPPSIDWSGWPGFLPCIPGPVMNL